MLDLLPALGSAHAPTVVAEALWIRDGDGHLVYPSSADQHAIASSERIVAVPFVQGWGWGELHRLQRAIREATGESTTLITFATNDALTPGLLPVGIGWVPILCLQPALPDTPNNHKL